MNLSTLVLIAAALGAAPTVTPDSLRVGERLVLKVEGEASLSDTFTVAPGPQITLPGIGAVALTGVARDSVASFLGRYLARYLRAAPPVQVTILMRVAVLGEVEHPGFYAVSSDQPLADVMMRAGGPTRDALMPKVRLERGEQKLMEGDRLTLAMTAGTTVGAAGLESGDRIVVPRLDRADPESKFRIISILIALPVAAYGVVQLFK
jgi:protein involved in polysaccharide export with SLBB domain